MLSKEDALRAYAAMMNTLDIDQIASLLADDFHYASQWVLAEIESKQAYLDYIGPKLLSIKTSGSKVWAEMASLEREIPGPCAVMAQGSKDNLVSLVLAEVANDKITRLDMCCAPSPHSATRSGEYPGRQTADDQPLPIDPNKVATSDRQTFNRFVNDLHSGQSIEQMSPAMQKWWRDRY
jgi:hypothetical protein